MFSNIEYIPPARTPTKHQLGLKKSQAKNYSQFGAILLNINLLQKSRLLTMYPSGGPTMLKKSKPITSTLVELITIIFQTNEIDIEIQKRLSPEEAKLFASLIKISKLGASLNYKAHVLTIADHVKRYNVLRGGLNAGNHAPEILDELKHLTSLLSNPHIQIVSESDAEWILELLDDLRRG